MWLRSIWYILTLRCEEADRLRTADGSSLCKHQKIAERIHRSLCSGCRRAARQLERIDRGLQDIASRTTSSEDDPPHPEWDQSRGDRLAQRFREISHPGDEHTSGGPGLH